MSAIERARLFLSGTTPGPWVFNPHEERDYDTATVGAGTYLSSPGCYTSTDLIHEVDTYSYELDSPDIARIHADARFIAAARTLVPELIRVCEAWIDVADERLRIIERLRAEHRNAAHEVARMRNAAARRYCNGCGGAFIGEHECGRTRQ